MLAAVAVADAGIEDVFTGDLVGLGIDDRSALEHIGSKFPVTELVHLEMSCEPAAEIPPEFVLDGEFLVALDPYELESLSRGENQ